MCLIDFVGCVFESIKRRITSLFVAHQRFRCVPLFRFFDYLLTLSFSLEAQEAGDRQKRKRHKNFKQISLNNQNGVLIFCLLYFSYEIEFEPTLNSNRRFLTFSDSLAVEFHSNKED